MKHIGQRLTAAIVSLVLLWVMLPAGLASAADVFTTADGYQYRIKPDGTAKITGYVGVETQLMLPDTLDDCSVSEIGALAFRNHTTMQAITIPDTVTYIGDGAFDNCTALDTVCLPEGLDELRFVTFRDCTALQEIVLPASLTSIDSTAFKNCSSLKTVYYRGDADTRAAIQTDGPITALSQATWYYRAQRGVCGAWVYAVSADGTAIITRYTADTPDVYVPSVLNGHAITAIGAHAFASHLTLETLTVSRGITAINDRAFSGCKALRAVTLPDSLTTIGRAAFSDCDGFETITVPDSVTSLGAEAFSNCDALRDVALPDGITTLPDELFANCTALQDITLPASITAIGDELFFGCSALETIVLPDGITQLGAGTFEACTALQRVTLPASLDEIGKAAFYGCTALTTITLPDSVTVVRENAFEACTALRSVDFSANLQLIETRAFRGCTALKQIELPSSLYILGDDALSNCTALQSVVLPRYLDILRNGTFLGCTSLRRITLPPSLTTIQYDAFRGCTALTDLALPASLTTIEPAFVGCDALTTIRYDGDETTFHSTVTGAPYLPQNAAFLENAAPIAFPDVTDTAWYIAAADHVSLRGWMTGFADGRFGGAAPCERQDLVLMLARIEDVDLTAYAEETGGFTDVVGGGYYAPAVAWGVESGILTGYRDGRFGVGDPITREQLCTMLYRAAGTPPMEHADEILAAFPDGDRVSAFAIDAYAWAIEEGIIRGMADGHLAPTANASRAQVATILMRCM